MKQFHHWLACEDMTRIKPGGFVTLAGRDAFELRRLLS